MAPSDHRIPRVYKEGAKILKEVLVSKRGLKEVIYSNRNRMLYKKLFVLLDKYLDNQNSVNNFIKETKLAQNVKDEYLVKILCTELLHGRQSLPSIENNTMMTVNKAFETYHEHNDYPDTSNNIPTKPICDNSLSQLLSCKKKLRYVRVNSLILSVQECVMKLISDGFQHLPCAMSYNEFLDTIEKYTGRKTIDQEYFIQDYHLSDVLVFLQSTQFHNYALYKNGSLFLQDKASCVPTHLLSPPENSVVFDTCAAPGNKTLHLAAFMHNTGTVYAVDKDPKRFKYMKEVIDLAHGAGVVQPILSDIFEMKMADYTDVEYVLVDPSCSGTGITERAKIDNHQQMSAGRIKNLSGFQKDLLSRVCSYFPHAKRIVYCTCSVQEEENEQVVEDVISKHGDRYEVEDLRHHPTLTGWKHFGSDKYPQGRKCFYALPQDYCTGFFAAVFNRKEVSSDKRGVSYNSAKEVDEHDGIRKRKSDGTEDLVETLNTLSRKSKKKNKQHMDSEMDTDGVAVETVVTDYDEKDRRKHIDEMLSTRENHSGNKHKKKRKRNVLEIEAVENPIIEAIDSATCDGKEKIKRQDPNEEMKASFEEKARKKQGCGEGILDVEFSSSGKKNKHKRFNLEED